MRKVLTMRQQDNESLVACTFLAGVDRKKHGKVINELNNAHLTGQKNCPKTVEGAMVMLSHCMGVKPQAHRSDAEATPEMSFAQKRKKNVTCFKCGQKGHHANECEEDTDSDNELIGALMIASTRSRQRVDWSGQCVLILLQESSMIPQECVGQYQRMKILYIPEGIRKVSRS